MKIGVIFHGNMLAGEFSTNNKHDTLIIKKEKVINIYFTVLHIIMSNMRRIMELKLGC